MKYYTGTGDSELTEEAVYKIMDYAARLSSLGYILRTGGEDGADKVFAMASCNTETILPWAGFNGEDGVVYKKTVGSIKSIIYTGKKPAYLGQGLLKRIERVYSEISGVENEPSSEFLVCWTEMPKGVTCGVQAVKVARSLSIPVYNLNDPDDEARLDELLKSLELQTG